MVPVRVVADRAERTVSVVSAGGHRIEGLTLQEAVAVLRRSDDPRHEPRGTRVRVPGGDRSPQGLRRPLRSREARPRARSAERRAVSCSSTSGATGCKVLVWDGTGLCIFQKRLERGRFASPWQEDGEVVRMTPSELALFIEGCELVGRRALSPDAVVSGRWADDEKAPRGSTTARWNLLCAWSTCDARGTSSSFDASPSRSSSRSSSCSRCCGRSATSWRRQGQRRGAAAEARAGRGADEEGADDGAGRER